MGGVLGLPSAVSVLHVSVVIVEGGTRRRRHHVDRFGLFALRLRSSAPAGFFDSIRIGEVVVVEFPMD